MAGAGARVCRETRQVPPRTWGLARLGAGARSEARGRGRKAAEGAQSAPSGGGGPERRAGGMWRLLTYPVPGVRFDMATFR